MTEQNSEPDDEQRASEEVDETIVDIYEDVPEFDKAPWAHDEIEAPAQDDVEELS